MRYSISYCQYSGSYNYSQDEWKSIKKSEKKSKGLALPIAVGLITTGLTMEYSGLFDKSLFQRKALHRFPNVTTHVDDYFQFTPIAVGLGMQALGKKGEHKFFNQIKRLLLAEAICNGTVTLIKTQTAHLRPDGSSRSSFPSGHTAQAFVAAAWLDKEFGRKYPWVRYVGYSMAVTTGVCRVLKNRHWATDVVLGAGIGFLSADLTYRLFERWENKKNLRISPLVGTNTYGISLVYRF
jgi:membrane-associated phospholipid phosphatase